MQVPLTGHLREPAHVDERPTGVVADPSFKRSSPPLSVVEQLAVAVAAALAISALLWGDIADAGHIEPEKSVSECEHMWSLGRWSAEIADVGRDDFIAACTRRPGN